MEYHELVVGTDTFVQALFTWGVNMDRLFSCLVSPCTLGLQWDMTQLRSKDLSAIPECDTRKLYKTQVILQIAPEAAIFGLLRLEARPPALGLWNGL